jgi:hypothetical protein
LVEVARQLRSSESSRELVDEIDSVVNDLAAMLGYYEEVIDRHGIRRLY